LAQASPTNIERHLSRSPVFGAPSQLKGDSRPRRWMWAVVNSQSTSWNVVERLCFPAPQPSYTIKSFPGELILLPRDDGAKVPCVFLPFKHARFLLLYFHGNAEDLGLCYSFCASMRDQFQVHMLAVEYPGYGVCPGPCDEAGVVANASAALDFVMQGLNWPRDGIMILGRSLGTGPAVSLASKFDVAGLILVTPFLSIREVFRGQIGSLADYLKDRFDNMSLIALVRSPTLIIHGQKDSLIPCSQGQCLYHKLTAKKMMVCPAEMDHNTSLLTSIETFVLPMIQFFSLPDYAFDDIDVPDWVYPDTSKTEQELLQRDGSLLGRVRQSPTPSIGQVYDGGTTARLVSTPHPENGIASRLVSPRKEVLDPKEIRESAIPSVRSDDPASPPSRVLAMPLKMMGSEAPPRKPKPDAAVDAPPGDSVKPGAAYRSTSARRSYDFATPPATPRGGQLTPRSIITAL